MNQTTTGGYDPAANSLADNAIGVVWRGVESLLHQSGLWGELWDDAAEHVEELRNFKKRPHCQLATLAQCSPQFIRCPSPSYAAL